MAAYKDVTVAMDNGSSQCERPEDDQKNVLPRVRTAKRCDHRDKGGHHGKR